MIRDERGRNRVVVTGLGAVTCLGHDAETTWRHMLAGESGIRRIRRFDVSEFPIKIAGEVQNWDADAALGPDWAAQGERMSELAMQAGLEAARSAGFEPGDPKLEDAAVVMANAHGDWDVGTPVFIRVSLEDGGPAAYSPPEFWQRIFYHAPTYMVARRLGAHGPAFTVSCACVSGAKSVERAVRWLRRGHAQVAFAGGTETVVDKYCVQFLHTMRALTAEWEDEPAQASRPFNRDRAGFVVAEGAGVLTLETLEHAQRRGATILAEVAGVGGSANAHSLFAPEPVGEGPSASMDAALRDAQMDPAEIDLILAHATATEVGDPAEADGFRMTFGDTVGQPSICATKSMIGHAIGASGAIGAINLVQALRDGAAPPILNLNDLDTCGEGLRLVRGEAESRPYRAGLANAFGFGGTNASLVFKRFDG
ncbi:MAG: beta-ketoacyl-[acyl-carrier-protein] synthase family protein [Phycisphaerales bacterium]